MKRYMSVLALGVFAAVSSPRADMITLSDPSFESAFYGTMGNVGSGWFTFGNAAAGVWVNGDGFWNMTYTDGTDAAYATQYSETDGGSIYQAVTLDVGVTYKLTVGIGCSSGAGKNDAKYALVFFNSNFSTLQAETAGVATWGTNLFSDNSVQFTPTSTGTYHVGVRNRGYVPGTGADNNQSTVFFDNVRLAVIPEPGTIGLLGLFGAAALLRRRMMSGK